MRRALSPPPAGDGEEDFRCLGHERLLQLGGKHQVSEPEMLMGEGREDTTADAEVASTHVSIFLGVVKTEGQFPKVVRVHETDFPGGGVMDQNVPRRAASILTVSVFLGSLPYKGRLSG